MTVEIFHDQSLLEKVAVTRVTKSIEPYQTTRSAASDLVYNVCQGLFVRVVWVYTVIKEAWCLGKVLSSNVNSRFCNQVRYSYRSLSISQLHDKC